MPWPRPSRLVAIGLDLAWSSKNPTGGAVAAWSDEAAVLVETPRADLGGNDDLLEYVRRHARETTVVAIDCPLAVPNRTGLRDCDTLVNRFYRRFQAGVYPANQGNLGRYGGLRGVQLARRLRRSGFSLDPRAWAPRRVVEVYPHAAMIGLFGLSRTLKYKPRQGRSYAVRWRELRKLQRHVANFKRASPPLHVGGDIVDEDPSGLRGAALKDLEDRLDAIVCAYVGLLYGIEGLRRCAVFGDRTRGHIVIPVAPPLVREMQEIPETDLAFDRRPGAGTQRTSPVR